MKDEKILTHPSLTYYPLLTDYYFYSALSTSLLITPIGIIN